MTAESMGFTYSPCEHTLKSLTITVNGVVYHLLQDKKITLPYLENYLIFPVYKYINALCTSEIAREGVIEYFNTTDPTTEQIEYLKMNCNVFFAQEFAQEFLRNVEANSGPIEVINNYFGNTIVITGVKN